MTLEEAVVVLNRERFMPGSMGWFIDPEDPRQVSACDGHSIQNAVAIAIAENYECERPKSVEHEPYLKDADQGEDDERVSSESVAIHLRTLRAMGPEVVTSDEEEQVWAL